MRIRVLLRACLVVVCLAGAIVFAITYSEASRLTSAFGRFASGHDFERSLREMRAVESPLNPSAFRDGAIAASLLHTGHPVQAERKLDAATRREPDNAEFWYGLTRIQLGRRRLRAARVSYARARSLDPHLPAELPAPL